MTNVLQLLRVFFLFVASASALAQVASWTTAVPGVGVGSNFHTGKAATAFGTASVAFAGSGLGGNGSFVTTKVSYAGAVLWQKTFTAPAGFDATASSVAIDAAGNVIVTGYTFAQPNLGDVRIIKYASADGAVLWEKTADSGFVSTVAIDSSGNAIVATEKVTAPGNLDVRMIKYSAADGSLLWERVIDGGFDDFADDVGIDSSGNVVVAVSSVNATDVDIRMVKLSGASGAVLWERVYDSGHGEEVSAVAVDSSGNVLLTGYTKIVGADVIEHLNIIAMKLAGDDGRTLWQKTVNHGRHDWGRRIVLDGSGNAVVGSHASSPDTNSFDFGITKFAAADGAVLWDRTYDSGDVDLLEGIGIDSGGFIHAVGSAYRDGVFFDARILRLAPVSGVVLGTWIHSGRAESNDSAFSVAPVGTGVLVVGGQTDAVGTSTVVRQYDFVAAPAPFTPAPGAPQGSVATLTPTFLWTPSVSLTEEFNLLIARTDGSQGGFSVTLSLAQAGCPLNTGACAYTLTTPLANDASYTWQVSAANRAGTSAFSAPRPFTVQADGGLLPERPTLGAPEGNISTLAPMFLWVPAARATGYELRLSVNSIIVNTVPLSLAQASCPANLGACGYTFPAPLAAATTYRWQVAGTNASGIGSPSDYKEFTTPAALPVPAPPVPAFPQGAISTTTPFFLWTPSPGATSYRLEVTDASGAAPNLYPVTMTLQQASCAANTGACGYASPPLPGNTTFTWKVRGENASGAGAFSAPLSFTTSAALAVPRAPIPGQPQGTIDTLTPMFLWVPSSGSTSYTVQVLDASGNVLLSAQLSLIQALCGANFGACGYTFNTLLANQTLLQWRVRGENISGAGPFSSPVSFMPVVASVPLPPVLGQPSGAIGTRTPFYLWVPSPGATQYSLSVLTVGTPQLLVLSLPLTLAQASCPSNSGACGYQQPTPLAPGTYQWSVSASGGGAPSNFSPWNTFTVP